MALETAERVLAQGEASRESLLELQRLIAREIVESRWVDALKGDRAGNHFCYDNMRAGKVTRDPLPRFVFAADMTVWDHLEVRYPQWKLKHYPAHLRFVNRMIEIAELPLHEQKQKFNELAKEQDSDLFGTLGYVAVSNCLQWHKWELVSQAKLRTAFVALACERYRLQQKRWPTSLDVLVADKLLAKLPVDPVDGQPLRYREDAEGVNVYSLGPDETDNQGNIRRATPVEPLGKTSTDLACEPGADVGFRLWNVPRRRDAALPAVVIREPRDDLGPAGPAVIDMD
jgi:type II secretory pathway pseudopilin PulG